MKEPLKFTIGFSGDSKTYHVRCEAIDYYLPGFKSTEDAYYHAKKAEYEFNLIREKHLMGDSEVKPK
ncbi:hypothetical protein [Paenibacillus sp. GYB003]|uniref:hypothetical protein n=1 Tax=Paenibacillus sp. GYB003 TaxID=2994392 RepID=UPI002F96A42F